MDSAAGLRLKSCKPNALSRQFMLPQGMAGAWVGRRMAFKNAPMNRLAVELLEPAADDAVLEIGFGPGIAIGLFARRAGFVAGVDPSSVMLDQAARRNRAPIAAGKVELKLGSASHLPYPNGRFHKVCAINSFHLWNDHERDLMEVRRVMREGATPCLRMRLAKPRPLAAPGFSEAQIDAVSALVRGSGFSDLRVERRMAGRDTACLTARR
ncbi:MAG: class I SAM-dependent methyltransferase [Burkholderiales bacterium]